MAQTFAEEFNQINSDINVADPTDLVKGYKKYGSLKSFYQ